MLDVSLVALFLLFLALVFILLSLFLYLAVKKHMNNKARKEVARYKEDVRLNMFHYLQTGNERLLESAHDTPENMAALVELLGEYGDVLEGAEVRARIRAFATSHLSDFLRKGLTERRWSLRMNALYAIEDFHMDNLVEPLHEQYGKKHITVAEKAQILQLLAKFNDPQVLSFLKKEAEDIPTFSMLSILSNLSEEAFSSLIGDFDQLPTKMRYMVVDVIGDRQMIDQQPLLQKLLEQEDEELQIRSLKAFAQSGMPVEERLIASFLDSRNWRIRMMAIKVAGTQRLEACKPALITHLSDREYGVRAEAAKAILRFRDGERLLEQVIEKAEDLFAKDMAVEWLEKERGHYSY